MLKKGKGLGGAEGVPKQPGRAEVWVDRRGSVVVEDEEAKSTLGEWFVPKEDSETSPTLALQVTAFFPPSSLSVSLHRVLPNRFIVRPSFGDGTFHIGALSAVHVVGSWLAGPFHTGAGLGARLDILQDGCPSVADIRRRLYTQLPLDHATRWIHVLPAPPPFLPDLSHDFLREQPRLQRDVMYRFYSRALPSGSRFNFAADRGACSLCLAAPTETIYHIFYECGVAPAVISALSFVARRHLHCSPPPELLLFPLASRAGQVPPWSLLVRGIYKSYLECTL
ncbi:unnamed protein product [Closterium sp. NIES-64]|nr:unnamed protein product [Closterium sp. NIES-64]